jgi:hypothetical protein
VAAPNTNFSQDIATATWKYLTTQLQDQIFEARKLMGVYKKMGAVKEVDGGERLIIPLEYATNPSVAAAAPWDEINIAETDEVTIAEYEWKQYNGACALSDMDVAKNSGETRVIALVETKVNNLKNSLQTLINQDLYLGSSGNALKFHGLNQLVATGSIGNIAGATFSWWRSYHEPSAEALDDTDMETAFNSASDNIDPPNVIITTQTLFEKYIDLARGTISTNKPDAMFAEMGFKEGATFRGVPIIWDSDCPSGAMFFLNTKHIGLKVHRDFNFKMKPSMEMPKQHVFAYKTILIGEHVVTSRRFQGKLTGRTAS